jgi:hypothetical protein
LVLDEGQPVAAAAHDRFLTESSLRNSVERARPTALRAKTEITPAEREELAACTKKIASSRRNVRGDN